MAKSKHDDDKEPMVDPPAAALAEIRKAQQAARNFDWHRVAVALEAAAKLLESH